MISKEFFKVLEGLAEDRGIDKDRILDVMKKGLESAYKKTYDDTTRIRVEFNIEKNKIQVFAQWLVVSEFDEEIDITEQILIEEATKKRRNVKLGDILEEEVTPKDFGRIAALTAKQVLMQGLKNIEREQVFEVFKEKENETINAVVLAYNKGYYSLDLGHGATTGLPDKELLPTDELNIGDRIKVYISSVEMTTKGPKILVSRTDANLVMKLLEQAVPEISDNTIEIMGISRNAGDRCKICVKSNDENVDPIGACLGRKGERIKDVIRALNGEKIDLFSYSPDEQTLIANSLQPSEVLKVIIKGDNEALAIVPDDQLSLAIGKKGQNVRLAVNAIKWKIDIKSYSDAINEGYKVAK